MRFVAKLAEKYSGGLIRTTHTQNLLVPLVHENDLVELWRSLSGMDLSVANIGTVQDIICCPGIEYCSLANTTSIPIALEIQNRFTDREELDALGDIQIKISGCMNACGHHHIGHIGILGVDKKGEEWFQITLGGRADQSLKIGERLGPAVDRNSIVNVVELIIRHYLRHRLNLGETFLSTLERIGIDSFKEVVYA
jgi:sulfite reductase (NADPH) hemoprotein beta-component